MSSISTTSPSSAPLQASQGLPYAHGYVYERAQAYMHERRVQAMQDCPILWVPLAVILGVAVIAIWIINGQFPWEIFKHSR